MSDFKSASHKGHSGSAAERIQRAREHYETRADRRLEQIFLKSCDDAWCPGHDCAHPFVPTKVR